MTALLLAFIGTVVLFLPLFVFLPRLFRSAMKAGMDVVLEVICRNEQPRKVFQALYTATTGLVLAQVLDPATAESITGMITGIFPSTLGSQDPGAGGGHPCLVLFQ